MTALKYQSGFGNHFATESLEGALPEGRNSPQKPRYGLYAEQISGTAFTAPRARNRRSWLYRIRPSVVHPPFTPRRHKTLRGTPFDETPPSPNRLRWNALPPPHAGIDFIDGLMTMAGGGSAPDWTGLAVHVYAADKSMKLTRRYFYNADGEMLLVPQTGTLHLRTEMGMLEAAPGEIALIPRGIKFAVDLPDGASRGYVCENYGDPFTLPDLGPIGANGLANPRDFLYPVAAREEDEESCILLAKYDGRTWEAELDRSPLDVVAWHGNYAPCKYDLARFNAMNTVGFDHPDPSIFTVLTAPGVQPGTANIDFVIFPPRWMVAENTFRPPWFHRNVMSEYMGLIRGIYDAKEGGGFEPGGSSLHNCMTAHGPDAATVKKAMNKDLKPVHTGNGLAFMFESRYLMRPTRYAMDTPALQRDYHKCWDGMPHLFPDK